MGSNVVVPAGGAVLLEALLTMMLVLVVYASAVDENTKAAPGVAPLLIGLTVAAAHLVCIHTQERASILPEVLHLQYLTLRLLPRNSCGFSLLLQFLVEPWEEASTSTSFKIPRVSWEMGRSQAAPLS